MDLEEITAFRSPREFASFTAFIEAGIARGELKEIAPDPSYHAGEIYGGRWFERIGDGSIWRLLPPDPPFTGLFEQVDNDKGAGRIDPK